MISTNRKVGVSICGLGVALLVGGLSWAQFFGPIWSQWGQNPQHTGFVNVAGQPLNKILADIVYDALVPQEQARSGGDLSAHYQVPLVDGDDVFMEFKSGSFNPQNFAS